MSDCGYGSALRCFLTADDRLLSVFRITRKTPGVSRGSLPFDRGGCGFGERNCFFSQSSSLCVGSISVIHPYNQDDYSTVIRRNQVKISNFCFFLKKAWFWIKRAVSCRQQTHFLMGIAVGYTVRKRSIMARMPGHAGRIAGKAAFTLPLFSSQENVSFCPADLGKRRSSPVLTEW